MVPPFYSDRVLLQLKVREKLKWCAAYANAHHCSLKIFYA
jgi:hypothetical protein